MSFSAEPIHLVPRMLPRRWGRKDAPAWCGNAPRPQGRIGEIWLAHPNNVTRDGRHLGALLADAPQEMLGDLGRAPPSVRLVLTDEPSDQVRCDGPLSLWSILESPLDGVMSVQERETSPERTIKARRGALLRADAGVGLRFGPAVTALEARANFSPSDAPKSPRLRHVAHAGRDEARAVWLRDEALSVELWTLPEISFLEPDGETCHVVVAMTPGVTLDGRSLSCGEAVLVPAEAKRVCITGRGAKVLAAYPDIAPTQIWKPGRPPRPAALAVDPASLIPLRVEAAAHARTFEGQRAAA